MNPLQLLQAMQVAQALASLIAQASANLHTVTQTVTLAQQEGRVFTPDEWARIIAPSSIEIANLQQAIAVAKNPNSSAPAPTNKVETTVIDPTKV